MINQERTYYCRFCGKKLPPTRRFFCPAPREFLGGFGDVGRYQSECMLKYLNKYEGARKKLYNRDGQIFPEKITWKDCIDCAEKCKIKHYSDADTKNIKILCPKNNFGEKK